MLNLKELLHATSEKFEDLLVWQKAHQFTIGIYNYTRNFPREEAYGLTSQFRRSAVSIAANIAEGFKKKGEKDKAKFMNISQGSLEECRYYLILSGDLGYGDNHLLRNLLDEVGRMLASYHNAIVKST
ncbi:four helix bundle protein [Paraflavitalea speifideaquila]|uniref:four helix bundle protein n=1 Tax=Paraflavitalea speifideaquila TaxID=3076558 RepID=UPI0028E9691C|nr:four helix bundle protein [Paraflavitalea speifideiaquila]